MYVRTGKVRVNFWRKYYSIFYLELSGGAVLERKKKPMLEETQFFSTFQFEEFLYPELAFLVIEFLANRALFATCSCLNFALAKGQANGRLR